MGDCNTWRRKGCCGVRLALPAATLREIQVRRAPLQRCSRAFTLAELVVTVGVLVLLVLLFTQLLKSAVTVTTQCHKGMDLDSQARQVLDRMAIDFAQMVKRSDVDYYIKSAAASPLRSANWPDSNNLQHNDIIAFYSAVPGYYPSGSQSPVSLLAYRVNSNPASPSYNKLERMGKGLVWNAVSPTYTPVVFIPIPVASPIPLVELPNPPPNPLPVPAWPETRSSGSSSGGWSDSSEVFGSQIFRFEYYYLLKGQTDPTTSTTYTPILTDIPWDVRISSCCLTAASTLCCHNAPEGMQDVAAIVVDIAVIDPKSKALLDTVDPTGAKLRSLNGADGSAPLLVDYAAGMAPGQLLANWRAALDANTVGLPQPAVSGITLYERYLYLSPPNLQTP